jgi:flagellar motor component MotA
MLRGIVWFVALIAVFCLAIAQAMDVFSLLDLPSVFIVVGGALTLLLIAFPLSDWGEAIGFVFSGKKELPKVKSLKLSRIYAVAGEFFIYSGVVGTFIGFVLMLMTMDDPSTIGPKLAVALITMYYGITLYLLTLLLQRKVSLCKVNDEQYELKPHNVSISFPIALVIYLVIMILGIHSGGDILGFLDAASCFIVVGGTVSATLLFTGPGDLGNALKSVFSSKELTVEDAKSGLKVFNQVNDSVVFMFIWAFMISLIALLQTSFERSTVGPHVAVIMISLLYGVIIISFFRGFAFVLQRKLCSMNVEVEAKPFFTHGFIFLYSIFITHSMWATLVLFMD